MSIKNIEMPIKQKLKTNRSIDQPALPNPIVSPPVASPSTDKEPKKKIRYINYLFKAEQPFEEERNFSKYFEYDGQSVSSIDFKSIITDSDSYLLIKTAFWRPPKFDMTGLMKEFKLKHVKNSYIKKHEYIDLL